MQSRRDRLYLLPALPKAWKKGSVENFHAQDGVLVSFFWEEGELTSFELTASEDMMLCVLSGDKEWDISLKEGQTRYVRVKE